MSKKTNNYLRYLSESDFDNIELGMDICHTPIGTLSIIASNVGIKKIHVVGDDIPKIRPNETTKLAVDQLERYFAGSLRAFDVPLDLGDHTPFAIKVWQELLKIPYGHTITYAQLAYRLGNPLCIRAAAQANSRNPIPVIIPCHRVIGSDGSLTGFALGLDVKRKLLMLENAPKFGVIQMELF